jgi:hypothetical protein
MRSPQRSWLAVRYPEQAVVRQPEQVAERHPQAQHPPKRQQLTLLHADARALPLLARP